MMGQCGSCHMVVMIMNQHQHQILLEQKRNPLRDALVKEDGAVQ